MVSRLFLSKLQGLVLELVMFRNGTARSSGSSMLRGARMVSTSALRLAAQPQLCPRLMAQFSPH
jgi:hypothetical protein